LLVLALAFGFLSVGLKGFSPQGVPIFRHKTLKGGPGYAIGGACDVCGLTIFAAGVWDFVGTYFLRPSRPAGSKLIVVSPPPPYTPAVNAFGPPEFGHGLDADFARTG